MRLSCRGHDDPHVHVGLVSNAVEASLAAAGPQLVVVQGDTSTALGAALAARLAGIPVAHVEAGLRSHDRRRPWPEEEFRVAIDGHSELLFAPTPLSAANLRRERLRGRIHVTGNSGIDAVLGIRRGMDVPVGDGGIPRLLVTCHRRENWGDGISGIAAALKQIAAAAVARAEIILHPNPALCRQVRAHLEGEYGIAFRDPCGHSETVAAMLRSDLVLSDSGGLQEEAAALGVPLLVLRDKTERPEAIACGSIELVGTNCDRIVAAVRRRLNGNRVTAPALPFGDGRASQRIAAIIGEWLEERRQLLPRLAASPRLAWSSPTITDCPRQSDGW